MAGGWLEPDGGRLKRPGEWKNTTLGGAMESVVGQPGARETLLVASPRFTLSFPLRLQYTPCCSGKGELTAHPPSESDGASCCVA